MKAAIIIPAREKSTRFPGKPLADILGKPMIQHVYERCVKALDEASVFIATDSESIKKECEKFNGNVIMTSEDCLTGTDRVYEAGLQIEADLLINVQGDEPMLDPEDIKKVIQEGLANPEKIINAMTRIRTEEEYLSPTVPKVVFRNNNDLLYMSRAGIPSNKQQSFKEGFKQVCIYSFPKMPLKDFYEYGKKTRFEEQEDIEILRFLEMGYDVSMVEVEESTMAVDTKEDLERVIAKMKEINGL